RAPFPTRRSSALSVGLSLPHAAAQLAPRAPSEQRHHAVEAYKHAFRAARLDGSLHEPLFDGISAVLERLHAAGWILGVATGKSDRRLTSCPTSPGVFASSVALHPAAGPPSKPK